jgi:hypothetical protein
MATVEDYYNGDEHGTYQYVSFNSIIDDLVEDSLDQDSYLKNTLRSQFIKHAKKGIRVMNFNALNAIKGLELTIPPSMTVVLPVDFVDWARVSVLLDDGFLYTLGENKKMPTASSYLQDESFDILFDNEGFPITGDSDKNAFANPFIRRQLHPTTYWDSYGWGEQDSSNGCRGAFRNQDTSYYNRNGEFKVDMDRGAMAFSSELSERSVLLEYVADGLEGEKIWGTKLTVHKYIVDAVHDYVYWQIIRKRRNVNATEKAVARREYFNSRRLAKVRLGSMSANAIRKAMSAATKWI